MDLLFTLNVLLAAATVYCGRRALRLDGELRRLLPPVVEHQWRADAARELRRRWFFLDASLLPWLDPLVLPPARWQPHLHSERGAMLVFRFYRFVGLASLLAAASVILLAVLLDGLR